MVGGRKGVTSWPNPRVPDPEVLPGTSLSA